MHIFLLLTPSDPGRDPRLKRLLSGDLFIVDMPPPKHRFISSHLHELPSLVMSPLLFFRMPVVLLSQQNCYGLLRVHSALPCLGAKKGEGCVMEGHTFAPFMFCSHSIAASQTIWLSKALGRGSVSVLTHKLWNTHHKLAQTSSLVTFRSLAKVLSLSTADQMARLQTKLLDFLAMVSLN